MTIHHDKMAYGRLASLREDFSEERLEAMAKLLSENAEEKPESAATEKGSKDIDDDKHK